MQAAFNHVGSMPMKRITDLRAAKNEVLKRELRERQSKQNLRQAIQRGTSMTYVNPEGDQAVHVVTIREASDSLQSLKETLHLCNSLSRRSCSGSQQDQTGKESRA